MIAVCLKWVDRRPELDPLTGTVVTDERSAGMSAADASALEWALRLGEHRGVAVTALTAGRPPADSVVREALSCGAAVAVRVDLAADAPSDVVAEALAGAVPAGTGVVVCGDHSADRGSGSVPAYLAGRLGAGQALGLVDLSLGDDELIVVRRLDGGRRERLAVRGRTVLSVEGGTAALRRASLAAVLAARSAPVTVVAGPRLGAHEHRPLRPFRPRPRALAAPAGATALDRVRALTAATGASGGRATPVELSPAEAAERILDAIDAITAWDAEPDA